MLKYLTLTPSSTQEALVMTHDHLRLHLANRLDATETAISTLLAPNGAVMPKMRVSMVGMVANTARNRR